MSTSSASSWPSSSLSLEQEFAGRRVLVTGGTRGMGQAIAVRFLAAGARVAVTARKGRPDLDASLHFIEADTSTREGVAMVIDEVKAHMGGVDILINNVGGSSSPAGGFQALTDEHWEIELNTNLLGAVRLDRAFVPGMIEAPTAQGVGAGVVIHIASIQRLSPLPESTIAYAAAKAALVNYSKGLSKELGPKGVRVVCVSPGFIETEAAAAFVDHLAKAAGDDRETAMQKVIAGIGGIPLGKPGRPQDIAETVAFLASPRAAYIHGTEVIIDGGSVPSI